MIFDVLCTYFIAINIFAFAAFGLDKFFAVKKMWRISEATLISLCAAGGSVGGLIAMSVFRHKIRKPKFYVGVPAILVVQVVIMWFVLK